jgi:hypothetical protein
MFPERYWPDRYYPVRYWPKIGAEGPEPPTGGPAIHHGWLRRRRHSVARAIVALALLAGYLWA